jgi:hypothetical protein
MANTSIFARLGLDTSQFQTGLRTARRSATNFATGVGGQFAAAAGIAGMGGMVSGAIGLAREMTNMAKIAGLSVEEFQGLAYGAQTVGIEANKLSDIYKDMNDRVGDFLETGGGPMADFFENIAPQVGVTAEQFRDLNSADALQLYVSSLEEANLSQADMTFYMEAIASDSTALLPLLQDNGTAMAALAAQARNAGLILSNETANGLTESSVEMEQFKTRVQVGTGEITHTALPAFNAFGNTLTLIGDTIGTLGASFVAMLELLARNAQTWLTPVGNAFTVLGQNVTGVWHAINRNWDEAISSFAAADQAASDMADNTASIPEQMTANWDQFHSTLEAGSEQLATSWTDFYDDTRDDLGLLTEEEEAAAAARLAAAEEQQALDEENRIAKRKAHLVSMEEEQAFYALVDELNDEVEEQERQAHDLSMQNHAARQAAAAASRADALDAAREYRAETMAALEQREQIESRMGIVLEGSDDDLARLIELEQNGIVTGRALREQERLAREQERQLRRDTAEASRLQAQFNSTWLNMSAAERQAARERQQQLQDFSDDLADWTDDQLLDWLTLEEAAAFVEDAAESMTTSTESMATSTSGLSDAASGVVDAVNQLNQTMDSPPSEWQWLSQRQDQIITHLESIDTEVNRNP